MPARQRTLRVLLAGFGLLMPGLVVAEEAAAPPLEEGAKAVKLVEIERGTWARALAGPVFFFSTPGAGGGFSPGAILGLEVGHDFGESLQASLVVMGAGHSAPATYLGKDGKGRGDFESLLAAPTLRLVLGDVEDDLVPRTQFYLRAGAGLFRAAPAGVFGGTGVAVLGGPGLEYHTRLRHFAVAIEADGLYVVTAPAAGATLTGSLRYTF